LRHKVWVEKSGDDHYFTDIKVSIAETEIREQCAPAGLCTRLLHYDSKLLSLQGQEGHECRVGTDQMYRKLANDEAVNVDGLLFIKAPNN
jgi:hypothetical protein